MGKNEEADDEFGLEELEEQTSPAKGRSSGYDAKDGGKGTLGWLGLYISSSIGMTMLNKLVATGFKDHFTLLFIQAAMSVVFNYIGASVLGVFPPLKPFSASQFKSFSVPSTFFTMMLVTSLGGLPYVSIPTVVVFRAVVTCVVAVLDTIFFGNTLTPQRKLALSIVFAGAVVYSMHDITYNSIGYMWMTANSALVVLTQMSEKYIISNTVDQTGEGMAIIQNTYMMIIAVGMSAYKGEEPVRSFRHSTQFVNCAIFMTGIFGFLLNLSYIQLNKTTYATSIALSGWFSKVSSLIIGPLLFSDTMTFNQLGGALTSMLGVAMYTDAVWSHARQRPAVFIGSILMFVVSLYVISDAGMMSSFVGVKDPVETVTGG
eukprot:TRINITY_DN121188_c0_g1_i1.p1 TRINITY_DN121188_c0_g1~~TRINITY_DN121188_c0_g1_i1.p1  ORF type:complete len:374 (+),score=80.92 TRINITY_DN121188_c0_g1_i1:158-1279(+)